jgi:polar amino acid transport system permease protein
LAVLAQSKYTLIQAFATLWRWLPFVVGSGFVMNLLISFFTMLFGTVAGVFLGLGQISVVAPVRKFSWFITQLFRNSPWLVLLFIVMLTFPFEIEIGEHIISIPDWMKAVFGLSFPIMANISEVVRGAVQSVPTGQWEASESLAFSRVQTIWQIILPQCFKRMIPPWMNWYAILTMATPLVSLLGVEEIVTLSRQAMEAEDNHPELLIPFFGFALLIFFAYCYPIARWTLKLEERYSVKL